MLGQTVFLLIHFRQHTVGGNKGYLHTAEESRENHRNNYTNDKT